jgi:hypothetical protein
MTTVTISDDLRRKLKLLAARYDTSQAEIIRRAIETFENQGAHNSRVDGPDFVFPDNVPEEKKQRILKELEDDAREFEQKFPKLAEIHRELQNRPDILEEATIGNWEIPED